MKRDLTKSKSYKRELAVVLLIWFAYLVETKSENLIEILVYPVFTYSAIAFGLQWYSPNGGMLRNTSQSSNGGRPERSGKHPSGQNQQPNHWHVERHRTKTSETSGEKDSTNSGQQQS